MWAFGDLDAVAILAFTYTALLVSSVAGYGGSLVLVPALGALIGPKEGIALASLILGWNNLFKVIAYRRSLALREGWPLLLTTAIGVSIGARFLIVMPTQVVVALVIVAVVLSLLIDVYGSEAMRRSHRRAAVPAMAASAFLSGASGTSGPLKGIAVRSLGLPRLEHVGLASAASLVADALKAELFLSAGLYDDVDLGVVLLALPAMPVIAWVGRYINTRIDERSFRWIFWCVVGGYSLRLAGLWF